MSFIEDLLGLINKSDTSFASSSAASFIFGVLTIIDKHKQLFIMLFHLLCQRSELFILDVKKSRHYHDLPNPSIVIAIVKKLIQSVTAFLRLSDK